MSLIMGIVGLPNVGKSSLFNALTKGNALIENRPFATIEPNLGMVQLMDERLDALAKLIQPDKVVHSLVKFLDIAGLVKGASEGEGLGNKFLSHIREVDAICLVVRAFNDREIFSVVEKEAVDPVFEAEIVLCELIYADLEMVENILKKIKSNDGKVDVLNRLRSHLQENKLVLNFPFTEQERKDLKIYSFLTNKPMMILANTDDGDDSKKMLETIEVYATKINASFLSMNIKLEEEICRLSEEEQKEFLQLVGREGSCLNILVDLAFKKLGLNMFFTAGKQEVRSWTFRSGSTAATCAGLIHSDMEKGFIKARVIKCEDYLKFRDIVTLKKHGKIFYEGRDYLVQDGDVIHFQFNV